jgi:DNA-binding response OmpR family regulator
VLVDDDEDILDVLNIIFIEDGFRTVPCATHEEAIEALRAQPADLLVTDLRLSGSDGLDLIRFAQSLRPQPPNVILLTAVRLSSAEATLSALQTVGAQVVNKPFDIDQLIGIARHITGWPGNN